jgi:hypothetical protein
MPRSTTTNVAQAISLAVDEAKEGACSLEGGLYLEPDESSTLRVTEVGAELENAGNGLMSQFVVKTSDGQEWNVRITPKSDGTIQDEPGRFGGYVSGN